MDPRYSGRLSPPRRYAAPGRNSTGRLDTDYESYYQPRVVRDSPRASAERVGSRVIEQRLLPVSRSSRDDYYVAPRYAESGSRAPLTIVTPAGSSSRYRTVVSNEQSPYGRTRPRDYETYYVKPASSSHTRHFSIGGNEPSRYVSEVDRDRERDRPVYKSSGHRQSDYLSPTLPVRERRDRRDDSEYLSSRDQAYLETTSRPRTRRVSDLGVRERPTSFSGIEDLRREKGPPVTTRGLAKLEDDGVVRRYRYPRDEPIPRISGSSRDSREDQDRLRPPRGGLVAIHQEDGYSSNIEGRSPDKSHRHRHRDTADRDRHADDDRRMEEPIKRHQRKNSEDHRSRHHGTDSEDRRNRSHKYRDESQERRAPRDDGFERDDERREKRRYNDEPKKDKHDDRHLAEGVAIGAAGIGAAGALAEGLKHRHEKESSDLDSENKKDRPRRRRQKEDDVVDREKYDEGPTEEERPRRRRHKDEAENTRERPDGDDDDDRRERRRRRRRERTERELREKDEGEGSSSLREGEPRNSHGRPVMVPVSEQKDSDNRRELLPEDGPERTLRRHGRRRRERNSSSDTESSEDSLNNEQHRSRVRVVSPARDAEKKPKSILRQPTQQFPEDPDPKREGVAPMKDAVKKGVPSDARWTKVDRRIVNPEALDLAGERFVEHPDSVIVLRVLEKEEIEKLAAITQELRSRRAAGRQFEEQPRMIEGSYDRGHSSEEDRPKQIAAQAYNEPSEASRDSQHSDRSGAVPQEEQDRPSIQKEASYQRFAPPGVQPQSSIPTYPAIPGRSSFSASQPQTPSTAPLSPDPAYPSQGGGYRPSQA